MRKQSRHAPAYQEYASDMLARFDFRTLTLPQRGLLYSMRMECWVNHFLPESPDVLARIMGFDVAEVTAELPYVMAFFTVENGRIFSPELEDYRAHLKEVRERQSRGGKAGAAKTNTARKPSNGKGFAPPSGTPSAKSSRKSSSNPPGYERVLSRAEMSGVEPPSQEDGMSTTPVVGGSAWDEWTDFTQDPEGE